MIIDESTVVASAPTAHDRALRRKTAIVAPILIVVAAIVIYALLER
jgi:hypothetical protein